MFVSAWFREFRRRSVCYKVYLRWGASGT